MNLVKDLDFKPITRISALSLNGRRADGSDLKTSVLAALSAEAEAPPTAAELKEVGDLYRKAHAGDRAVAESLNALRVEKINNYIYGPLNFASLFFRMEELGDADRAVVQNDTNQEIRVGYIGEDGAPKSVKLGRSPEEALIPLKTLATERYGYRLRDLYNGSVEQAAQANINVAFDMANKIDQLAYNLLTASLPNGGAFGTFTTTGSKPSRVYVANSRIDTSNLPTSNDIQIPSISGSTTFGLSTIRTIISYCDQWGGAFAEGPLRPTGVIVVNSKDAPALALEVTPTGSTNNTIADGLMNNYTSFSYLGVRWVIVPDNTIPTKKCYVQLSRPPGTIYTKPSHDQSFEDVQPAKNWAERYMTKVAGFYIPTARRVNALRVAYQT